MIFLAPMELVEEELVEEEQLPFGNGVHILDIC